MSTHTRTHARTHTCFSPYSFCFYGFSHPVADKAEYLTTLGFDTAVNYKDPDFVAQLAQACPEGVDVYMDNVGGSVSDAVLRHVNDHARVPICGQISQYNSDLDYVTLTTPAGLSPDLQALLAEKQVQRGRFLVLEYQAKWQGALEELAQLVTAGVLIAPETVTQGFAPHEAFCAMMTGANFGKAIVEVTPLHSDNDVEHTY